MPTELRQELEDTITSLKAQVRTECLPETDQIGAERERACWHVQSGYLSFKRVKTVFVWCSCFCQHCPFLYCFLFYLTCRSFRLSILEVRVIAQTLLKCFWHHWLQRTRSCFSLESIAVDARENQSLLKCPPTCAPARECCLQHSNIVFLSFVLKWKMTFFL